MVGVAGGGAVQWCTKHIVPALPSLQPSRGDRHEMKNHANKYVNISCEK